jgi:redox-sensitive bicupin YhaK (pirin superfamily)
MKIEIYQIKDQAKGNFNNGEILENKPIGFPGENGKLKPYSNIFYWAHAWTTNEKSTIGLHPHKGFEICSFVLKGKINHYDTNQKKWISLSEGDVQIIRSGSGISHSEELMENSEIFQIWFDPDVSKSIHKYPSYNDYKKNDFDIIDLKSKKIKLIKTENSILKMDSEGIIIKEYYFKDKEKHQKIEILENKIHSFFLLNGEIELDKKLIVKGDFFKVSDLKELDIKILSNSKVFEIVSPKILSYKTYYGN